MNERWPVRAGDGHELDVYAERPDDARAALLFVPAMGVEARYYAHFAEALSREGVLFAACDLRGHGTSSLRPSRSVDFGYREIVERDLPAVMEVVRDQTEGLPLYVGGHSLGGQLMMLHLAATRPDIAGMVLVACAIPYYQNWQGRSRGWIRLATVLFPAAGFILGYVPGDRLGLGGKEARTLMRDWAHNAATARYEPIGSDVDYEAALATLGVDLVTINIDGDEMAPPNAVDFMFDKVPRAKGARVEAKLSKPKRGAHVRWARDSAEVVQAISRWLEARATA